MTVLNVYLWISTILFMFIGTVWTRRNWLNITLKIAFWLLALTSLLLALASSGIVMINASKLGVA